MRRKRTHMPVWLFSALLTVFLTVLAGRLVPAAGTAQDCLPAAEASLVMPQRQQPHEATLTDATQLYRICSSRPQRILPTQGSRSERTLTPSCSLSRRQTVKLPNFLYDSRCRQESAPFCLSASCDYYVIALRHIIR